MCVYLLYFLRYSISSCLYVGNRVMDFSVSAVRAHTGFSTTSLKNDIAIVEVDRNVVFSDRIAPVCLPDSLRGVDLPSRFGAMTIIGWGSEETGGSTVTALRQVLSAHYNSMFFV